MSKPERFVRWLCGLTALFLLAGWPLAIFVQLFRKLDGQSIGWVDVLAPLIVASTLGAACAGVFFALDARLEKKDDLES